MSPQQARVWPAHDSEDGPNYRVRSQLRIHGPLTLERFQRALEALVGRHELLRTRLVRLPAMTVPLQVIEASSQVHLVVANATDAPLPVRDTRHALQFTLVNEDERTHRLEIDCAAPWGDTRGLRNVARELALACAGELSASGDPLQYADLAEWQCELLEQPSADVGRDYWRRQDLSRAAAQRAPLACSAPGAFLPASVTLEGDALGPALLAFAAAIDAPPRAVLLAAWQTWIARVCRADEVVVGVTCDGRGYDELHDALGLVARDVPGHARYDGGLDLATAARRAAAALTAQERWQECYGFEATASGAPAYFPFGFEYHAAPAPLACGGLDWRIESEDCCLERNDLRLIAHETADGGLRLALRYDGNALDARDARRAARAMQALLCDAFARPTAPLASLALVSAEEAAAIDAALRGEADPRPPLCVHDLVAQTATTTPHAIAVADEHEALDYATLVARAQALAARLVTVGVIPDTPVALCLERSAPLAVALLGVLFAGGAYVPIDPALPAARQRYLLADSGARVLITRGAVDEELAAGRACIDMDEVPREEPAFTPVAVTPAHAAYVLYTSGSTGEPKGVVIEHRQLCNYVRGVLARLQLELPTSFALLSTLGADLGNTAVFGALVSGGTLHMVSHDCANDPEALADYMEGHGVEGLKIVPSHLHALLASPAAARLLPRRYLVLGGETLRWSLVERLRELAPGLKIFNHYGPTETTVGCLCGAVDADRPEGASVPLGTPLANVELAIVDGAGLPVPFGVAGELWIGGAGVARGYLRRPTLEAERFGGTPRRYRSGDLVRLRVDGQVEFMTRADDQVKVRGFRVEPGEVAATIASHASLADCAVLAQRGEDGEARLVACVVEKDTSADIGALRAWLAARLPDYMLPAQWLSVDALPRTTNGKLDRIALERKVARATSTQERGPGETLAGTQGVLAAIYGEQLGLTGVRSADKFFDLGGNSLGALQVVGRIKKATGVRVTPRDLLLQTLAQLATLIDQRNATRDGRAAG